MSAVFITVRIGGAVLAEYTSAHVPRNGETIRFRRVGAPPSQAFKVLSVAWEIDADRPHMRYDVIVERIV